MFLFEDFFFYNPKTDLEKSMKIFTNYDMTKTRFLFQVFFDKP